MSDEQTWNPAALPLPGGAILAELRAWPVSRLAMNPRGRIALLRAAYSSVGDLLDVDDARLICTRGFGRGSVVYLNQAVRHVIDALTAKAEIEGLMAQTQAEILAGERPVPGTPESVTRLQSASSSTLEMALTMVHAAGNSVIPDLATIATLCGDAGVRAACSAAHTALMDLLSVLEEKGMMGAYGQSRSARHAQDERRHGAHAEPQPEHAH